MLQFVLFDDELLFVSNLVANMEHNMDLPGPRHPRSRFLQALENAEDDGDSCLAIEAHLPRADELLALDAQIGEVLESEVVRVEMGGEKQSGA